MVKRQTEGQRGRVTTKRETDTAGQILRQLHGEAEGRKLNEQKHSKHFKIGY